MKITYSIISFTFFILTSLLFAEQPVSVVIDPGHGGNDTGARGTYIENGKEKTLAEKDIALTISQKLYTLLNQKYSDAHILLTRTDDTYLTFEERNDKISKDRRTDSLFISIHNNASFDTSINGFKVFVNTANKKNKLLADSVCVGLNKTIGSKMKNLGVSELPFSTKNKTDIIIEVGFLSNQSDILLLSDDEFLSLCANGIAEGIKTASAKKI